VPPKTTWDVQHAYGHCQSYDPCANGALERASTSENPY
jgi:hypothetical protein